MMPFQIENKIKCIRSSPKLCQLPLSLHIFYLKQQVMTHEPYHKMYPKKGSPLTPILVLSLTLRVEETFDFEDIHPLESIGPDVSMFEWHHFHLHHKDEVKYTLRTTNCALNLIDQESNGFLVDLTPPKLLQIGDGPNFSVDIEYQVCVSLLLLLHLFCSVLFCSVFVPFVPFYSGFLITILYFNL